MHGDVRPENVLVDAAGSARAIDPFGVSGERARDAAGLALWLREDEQAFSRVAAVADLTGLDRERVLAHAYLLAVGAWLFRTTYRSGRGRRALELFIDSFERNARIPL